MRTDMTPRDDCAELVARYGGAVYRMAYSIVRNAADADDVFQEVFLRYVKKRPRFESAQHQKAWLLRVAANCAKSQLRSAWNQKTGPLAEGDAVFAPPEQTELAAALRALPVKYRAVIHLFYYEGYSAAEIGGILATKPATVRTHLTRARARLKQLLKESDHV